ncbi:nucleoside deaminase [Occultella glacieicola]|uniref:tRNA-specific adenosine deaminase n=2 Tax=Occultella glacieicola TaxID=2518684 RepID=A0ABY2E1B9_9MICO|nr:nucleoside deaminase [Occultella glacieicola]
MGLALAQARRAAAGGDVPVGAVLVAPDGQVLAAAHNRREADGDPTAHAEILALRAAGVGQGRWRLDDCTLVVTLEPCTMCAGAIVLARVARVVLGAWDEKAGACGSTRDVVRDSRLNHRAEVTGGVRADECAALLAEFFAARRGPAAGGDEAPLPSH